MKDTNRPQRKVKTTDTVFDILEYVMESNGARLTDLATDLDLAKSTVHRHLETLYDQKYLVKENGVYYISLQFLAYGEQARSRKEAFSLVGERVDELASRTEERVQFIVEEHGRGVYVYRSAGKHAVMTDPGIGRTTSICASAAGQAILAHLPEERVREITDQHGLEPHTQNTITDVDELMSELETVRDRGYATNNHESVRGLRAVGVPILGCDGDIIGAISISGPTDRIKGERFREELPDLLMGTANELKLNIVHS